MSSSNGENIPAEENPNDTESRPVRRGRTFVFTANNPREEDISMWESLANVASYRETKDVDYVIFQEERGTGGVRHLQGYVEFSRAVRLSFLRRKFGGRIHWENRRGTQAQCIAYSKKQDTRVAGGVSGEGGTPKKLGKDTLAQVARELSAGKGVEELSSDYPVSFITHGSKIRSYALKQKGQRNFAPIVTIYYGKTGTGKSAQAQKNWPDAYWVPWPKKGGWWWPFYAGEETIILDEWRHQISYDEILRLFDRYPYTLEEKGSNMHFVSKRIVVTTNIHPINWFPGKDWQSKAPLRRRLRDFATMFTFSDDSTWDDPTMDLRNSATEFAEHPSMVLPDQTAEPAY